MAGNREVAVTRAGKLVVARSATAVSRRERLLAIEKLDVAEKRQVLQLLDAFIELEQLKRKAQGASQP